jgi:hypothetical protein
MRAKTEALFANPPLLHSLEDSHLKKCEQNRAKTSTKDEFPRAGGEGEILKTVSFFPLYPLPLAP